MTDELREVRDRIDRACRVAVALAASNDIDHGGEGSC